MIPNVHNSINKWNMNIHESNNVHSSDDMADTEMIQEKIGEATALEGAA